MWKNWLFWHFGLIGLVFGLKKTRELMEQSKLLAETTQGLSCNVSRSRLEWHHETGQTEDNFGRYLCNATHRCFWQNGSLDLCKHDKTYVTQISLAVATITILLRCAKWTASYKTWTESVIEANNLIHLVMLRCGKPFPTMPAWLQWSQ